MRLGFFIGQLELGGSERQVYLITRELHSCGAHVVVFTCHSGGFWHQRLTDAGIPVVVIPRKRSLEGERLLRLRQALKRYAPDVLFCFGSAEAFYGRLACLGLSSRAVACLRSLSWHGTKALWVDRLLKPLTAFYVTNSWAGQDHLQRWASVPPNRVHVIPNAVDRAEILAAGDRLADPGPPDAPKDAVWCAWVGSLTWMKDPNLLARVAALACAHEQWLRFLVAGDGPLRHNLERLLIKYGLERHVHLVGSLDDGPGIWRYVDFGLSTSRVEGTPNVLLEAMTWGKPYVAPPVGDYTHLISHEENGLLAKRRSAEELAELVIRLVRDEELRTRLSVNARETAKGFPSPAQVAEQYLNLARNLVQEVESV